MGRTPLASGSPITLNGSSYVIKNLIGEGGFSLIYSADAVGLTSSVVIKEFFPADGAVRGEDGTVYPCSGCEDRFSINRKRFENEGNISGTLAETSFQIIPFLMSCNGYALMKRESDDMHSISELVDSWDTSAPIPMTGKKEDQDPVFEDLVRLNYSLRVIESVLTVLKTVHESGILHLDISGKNVIWAGREILTGDCCNAFLADFGCSVEMNAGEYHPEYQLSYSPGFTAPEVIVGGDSLTAATDLYSVGVLLFYLCVGDCALEDSIDKEYQIRREIAYLKIPHRLRKELYDILTKAAQPMTLRYQSATDMLNDVKKLRLLIPQYPINPDNTNAFTLNSLKSMLEGSKGSRYSWADELCDRRQLINMPALPDSVYSGLTQIVFEDDVHFLKIVFPTEIFDCLISWIHEQPDKRAAVSSVLCCNYDVRLKDALCDKIRRYGSKVSRDLFTRSQSLLKNDGGAFDVHRRILFELLGRDGERLRECCINCCSDIRQNPHVWLAIISIFALLGPDGFKKLLPSPMIAGKLFVP